MLCVREPYTREGKTRTSPGPSTREQGMQRQNQKQWRQQQRFRSRTGHRRRRPRRWRCHRQSHAYSLKLKIHTKQCSLHSSSAPGQLVFPCFVIFCFEACFSLLLLHSVPVGPNYSPLRKKNHAKYVIAEYTRNLSSFRVLSCPIHLRNSTVSLQVFKAHESVV